MIHSLKRASHFPTVFRLLSPRAQRPFSFTQRARFCTNSSGNRKDSQEQSEDKRSEDPSPLTRKPRPFTPTTVKSSEDSDPNDPPKLPVNNPTKEHASATRVFLLSLNNYIDAYPMGMVFGFLGSRLALWFVLQRVLMFLDVLNGPEFAVAYMVARVTAKFRQPANVALAIAVIKMFPVLTILKLSKLLGLQQLKVTDIAEERKQEIIKELTEIHGVTEKELEIFQKQSGVITKAIGGMDKFNHILMQPLDKWGLGFFITMRLTNWVTLIAVATLINQGIDVMAFLNSWGISSTLGENFGAMGGAALINSPLFPMHLYIATKIAPIVNAPMSAVMRPSENPWESFLRQKQRWHMRNK